MSIIPKHNSPAVPKDFIVTDANGNQTRLGFDDVKRLVGGGGGLEPGTEPGQALVWNGTEWVKQSGYGWNAEAQVTLEYDGVIGEKYYIGEEGMPKLVKLSDITNIQEMEELTASGPGMTIVLPKTDLVAIAFDGGSGCMFKSTSFNDVVAVVFYRTGNHYRDGSLWTATEQTGFFVIQTTEGGGEVFMSKAVFDTSVGSKISGTLLSHSYLHNIYAENSSGDYVLFVNLITDSATPVNSHATFLYALGEAVDPSEATSNPLEFFSHVRPVSGGPFAGGTPSADVIPYGVIKLHDDSGDYAMIVGADDNMPLLNDTWSFSDLVSEIK